MRNLKPHSSKPIARPSNRDKLCPSLIAEKLPNNPEKRKQRVTLALFDQTAADLFAALFFKPQLNKRYLHT